MQVVVTSILITTNIWITTVNYQAYIKVNEVLYIYKSTKQAQVKVSWS